MRSGSVAERSGQDLECNVTFQLGIFGVIHLTHTARSDGRENLVLADSGAGG